MEDNLKKILKMEDDLNKIIKNGRQTKKNGRRPKKMQR